MDRTYADIMEVIADQELFMPMRDSTVLITGATGLIGSMLAKTLLAANHKYALNIKLVGQIRDKEKAKAVFGEQFPAITFLNKTDLFNIAELEYRFDYIIHTISPTTSRYFIEHPVETIKVSVGTTMDILETALNHGASLVYLSSMEQYGVPVVAGQKMTEDKIGIIDHLNIRSSYSESKRLCECLCVSYAAEYGVNVTIARLAQTIGAGAPLTDNRMPMQFARAAAEGHDIVLHTEGKSISNYVYLSDAIRGILTILLKGIKGEAYNICNDTETRSVREIAELVANEVADGSISVRIEKKENMGYAPDTAMYLDSSKLRSLGWNAGIGMAEAYRRLVDYLKEQ